MATMKARVELRGAMSHLAGGRKFLKGKPQILTNPSEIAYYKAQGGFSVTMMATEKTKAKAKPVDTGDDGDGDGDKHTEASLNSNTKAELQELAAEEFELELDSDDMKKADMVTAILEAQE